MCSLFVQKGFCAELESVLTIAHIDGSSDSLLEESRFLLPASSLNLTAMSLRQKLQCLKKHTGIQKKQVFQTT